MFLLFEQHRYILPVDITEGVMTQTAKVFMSGRSQAVRLPMKFRFSCKEVLVEKQGDTLVLRPRPAGWADFFARPSPVPGDFLKTRNDPPPEKRELF